MTRPAPTPASAFENKVVISEIHYWGDLENEFVELYIRENVNTTLFNWYITTYDDDKGTLPAIADLEEFCYVVVRSGSGTNDLDASDGTATVYLNLTSPILDDNDEVGLYDAQGGLVDFVRYGGGNGDSVLGDWPQDDLGSVAAPWESIQLQGEDQDNSGNWMSGELSEGETNLYEFAHDNIMVQIHNGITPPVVYDKILSVAPQPGHAVDPATLGRIKDHVKYSLSFYENHGFNKPELGPDNDLDIHVGWGAGPESTGGTEENGTITINIGTAQRGKENGIIDEKYVVEHELMHAIQAKKRKDAKGTYTNWNTSKYNFFDEGMAVYWGIESVKKQFNKTTKEIQDVFKSLGEHNVYDHFLDNLNRDLFSDWGGEYDDYIGSHLFIKFIAEKYGQDKLREIQEKIRNYGNWWTEDNNDKLAPKAIEEVLGKSIDQIVREWLEWLWLVAPESNQTPRPPATPTPPSENVKLNPWGSKINLIRIENEDPFDIHIWGANENDRFIITKLKYKKDNTVEKEWWRVYGTHYAPQRISNPGDYDNIVIIKTRIDNYGTGTLQIEITSVIAVDNTSPTITNKQPSPGSTTSDNTPTIGASYSDPSGIDTTSVKIFVDNVDVTASASVTSTGVTYTPTTPLAEGEHTVEVRVKDNVGNEATASWSFTIIVGEARSLSISVDSPVTAGESSSITVYAYDAEDNPVSGADISLSYTIPGGRDPWGVSLPLVDQGDGTYTSSLTSQWAGTCNIVAKVVGTTITASDSVSFVPGQVDEVVITSTSPRAAEPENTATVSFYFTDANGNVIPSGQIAPGVTTSFGELGQVITYDDDTFSVTLSYENLGTAEVTITDSNSGVSGSEDVVFPTIYLGATYEVTRPGIVVTNLENFEIQVENFEIQRIHTRVNVFVPPSAGALDNYEITIEYDNTILSYISTSDGDNTDNFDLPVVDSGDNWIKISQAGSSPGPSTDVAILTFGPVPEPVNFGYGVITITDAFLSPEISVIAHEGGGKVLKRLIVPLKIWIVDGSGVTEEDARADAQKAEDMFNKNAEACRSQYRHVYIVEINHISENEWDNKVPDGDIEGTEGVPDEEEDNQRKKLIEQNKWERWVNIYYVPDSSFVGMGWHTDNVIFIKDNADFDNRTLPHELVHEFSRSAVKDSPVDNAAVCGSREPGNIMNYDDTGDDISEHQGQLIDNEVDKRAEERPEEDGGGFIYKPIPY